MSKKNNRRSADAPGALATAAANLGSPSVETEGSSPAAAAPPGAKSVAAGQLREFLGRMESRKPQDLAGAKGGMNRAMVEATIITVVLIAVLTVLPRFLPAGATASAHPEAAPPAKADAKADAPKPESKPATKDDRPQPSKVAKSDPAKGPDGEPGKLPASLDKKAIEKIEAAPGGTKTGAPDLDKLLDK